MMWWCFHEENLAAALAAYEARRTHEGATEQQAKDDTSVIAQFLASPEAKAHKLVGGEV